MCPWRLHSLTVTARLDGYQPIRVSCFCPNLHATSNSIPAARIRHRPAFADADATFDQAVSFDATGSAIAGRSVALVPARMIVPPAPMLRADITMQAETKVVELLPGQTAEVPSASSAKMVRRPRSRPVRDLPNRVRVTDSGLSVLLYEDEDVRSFTILALPYAQPAEGSIYVAGSPRHARPAEQLRRH